jgi:rSAM/selenodomain-associated transferase 1
MSNAIALFAKAPVAGCVKTRLQPQLTPEQSASLHAALVADVWEKLGGLADADRWLYCDRAHAQLAELAPDHLRRQSDGDLGIRMLRCFEQLAAEGFSRILIVGADSPTLPAAYLRMGFELLTQVDAVLGPTEDGGYYAVGCRGPHPEMFAGVEWSTDRTFEQTEAAFDRAGLSFARLPVWYDIDRYDDLERLAAESEIPKHTRRWLEESPLAGRLGRESALE